MDKRDQQWSAIRMQVAASRKQRLSTTEAAKHLGIAKSTMDKMRSEGRGPRYLKLGGRVFYMVNDLDSYLESKMVETTDSRNQTR